MGGSSKKQTVGYRIYLGMHMILCHGVIDAIHEIKFGKKAVALDGPKGDGIVNIDAENLFGGEEREGGVSGSLEIETGEPTQPRNDYLMSQLDANVPAFRGVCGIIFRKMYLGMSAYLKRPAFKATRIKKRSNGGAQWYVAKAQIGDRVVTTTTDTTSTPVQKYIFVPTADFERAFINASNEQFVSMWMQSGYAEELPGEGGSSTFGVAPGPFGSITDDYETSYRDGYLVRKWFSKSALGVPTDGKLRINIGYKTDVAVRLNDQDLPLTYGATYEAYAIVDYASLPETNFIAALSQTLINGIVPYLSIDISGTFPESSSNTTTTVTGNPDMNPAHIIRECLIEKSWGMGYNESDIDDAAFTAAADQLYAEQMGISILWDKQIPIEDFVKEILKHIDAVIYVDRKTGKFVLKLIRADYDAASLIELGPHNVEKLEDYNVTTDGEYINEVTVEYRDGLTGNTASVTAPNDALIQMQGGPVSTTVNYLGFSNADIAMRAALRDLKGLSSPLTSCTIYAYGLPGIADLNPGSVLKLTWPDYGLESVVMRVSQVAIANGKSKRVRLKVTQDAFSLPNLVFTPPANEWIPPSFEDLNSTPQPVPYRLLLEAPYFELVQRLGQREIDNLLAVAPDAGYIVSAGATPKTLFAMTLFTNGGAGYVNHGSIDYCPTMVLAQPMSRLTTVVTIYSGLRMDQVALGSHCQIDSELCAVVAKTATTITLKRGVLDTVPAEHAIGARILFWDVFGESDDVEYSYGEVVTAKLVSGSASDFTDLSNIPADSVTLNRRAIRPYPPANVKINGVNEITGKQNAVVVTWVHRNRIQQTSTDLIGFYDDGVTVEPGVTYTLIVKNASGTTIHSATDLTVTTYTIPSSVIKGIATYINITLYSIRDGIECLQRYTKDVDIAAQFGDNLLFEMNDFTAAQSASSITLKMD